MKPVKRQYRLFLNKMNDKARELGLENTCFLTPNGLDSQVITENGEQLQHQTTAKELALVMRYCIMESPKKERFLAITQTSERSFTNLEGSRTFFCSNHNLFLQMMEGALTGKTGFTNKAGYCYVGALKRDERTFIVSLLACGWPNNKGYKWTDTRTLMTYGLEKYFYQNVYEDDIMIPPVEVMDGITEQEGWTDKIYVPVGLEVPESERKIMLLLGNDDRIDVEYKGKERLHAPVSKGDIVGNVRYLLNGDVIAEYPVYTKMKVDKWNYFYALRMIVRKYIPEFP